MNIADELEKLDELHRRGVLSSEEFEAGKRKILNGGNDAGSYRQLEEIKAQNEIAELDRAWEIERENYQIAGRYGQRYTPGKISSVVGGVAIVAFGIFWTSMASGMSSGMPGGMGSLFPLFGLVFVIAGAAMSIRAFVKAGQYEQAQTRYRQRREELQQKR